MSYIRFSAMILTSTVVMFILMYLNTYAFEHLFFSETRAYMAVLMGATMAFIMLGYMLGMYKNTSLNIAIFLGAIIVFALSLWLVRSQVTVSGPSFMRAMIPHHSIAVMTSERANIRDARVRKLADEIIAAQRREIAEMRYLIANVSSGNVLAEIYEDPPAQIGTAADARNNTLVAKLDPAPLTREEAARVLEGTGERCRFNRSPETDPILWTQADGGNAVIKLNGVIIPLQSDDQTENTPRRYSAAGVSVSVRTLDDEGDWRADAELIFAMDQGPTTGYHGFYDCR
jgi:hypothetical protein